MARSGLYKSDVKKARDSLLAQALYPSIDSVRMALGNTGSKTTIHKYLKELEEEEGAGPRKASISDALQDLVERLAARLQEEAGESVRVAMETLAHKEQELGHATRQLQNDLIVARDLIQKLEGSLDAEVADHGKTRVSLQAEIIAKHAAEQQVTSLKDRLAENERHRQSLEEKHVHSRDALEHYRQSAKDQRDQDHRRHEQQVQQFQAELRQYKLALAAKQEDVTRLNQEGVRLSSELAHTKQSLYEQLTQGRKQEQKIEHMQGIQQQVVDIERQLATKMAEVELLTQELNETAKKLAPASERTRALELQLAEANAKAAAQQQIGDQLRAYFDRNPDASHTTASLTSPL